MKEDSYYLNQYERLENLLRNEETPDTENARRYIAEMIRLAEFIYIELDYVRMPIDGGLTWVHTGGFDSLEAKKQAFAAAMQGEFLPFHEDTFLVTWHMDDRPEDQ